MERLPAGIAASGLSQANPLYLVADDRGVASLLAAKLAQAGITTQVVAAAPADATHLVVLSGLNACLQPQDAEREILGLFSQLQSCAASLQTHGGLLVTVQDTGKEFATGGAFAADKAAWMGGLGAFAKTAWREWPQVEAKAIAITFTDPETVAESLFWELVWGGVELEVELGEKRTTPVPIPAPVPLTQTPFDDGDVLVVSGGARGVAADCVLALATRQPLKFVLLGRSTLIEESSELENLGDEQALRQHFIARAAGKATPVEINRQVSRILASREIRNTLAKLLELGSEARYSNVDVTQTVDLEACLASIRQEWGAIHGVIHAAGILRDKAIADMTPEQFAIVFRTKVTGLQAMLQATQADNLKLLCCFSSIAARVGNPGQLNYNVANTTLNTVCLAEKARRPNCVVKSIGWGAWDGGMVTPALKRHFAAQGVELIERQAGANAFVEEIFTGADSAVDVIWTGALGRGFAFVDQERQRRAAVWFHPQTFPLLAEHIIHGVPVVPVCLAMEIAARFAEGIGSQQAVRSVEDIRVYKGIQLLNYDKQGDWISLNALSDAPAPAKHHIEFQDAHNRLNYRCTVEIGEPLPIKTFGEEPTAFGSRDWGLSVDHIYGDQQALFHTGEFQCISELGAVDKQGCRLTVAPKIAESAERLSNAIAIDGGIQGTLLWFWAIHRKFVLPTAIQRMRIYPTECLPSALQCYIRVVEETATQGWFDIYLVDNNQQVVVEIKQLECTQILKTRGAGDGR